MTLKDSLALLLFGVAGASLASCGGSGGESDMAQPRPDSVNAKPVAGSRIRPVYYDAGQVSTFRSVWQDSQLNLRCQFVSLGDGSLRCEPVTLATPAAMAYGDDTCSKALATLRSPSDTLLAVTKPSTSCFASRDIHKRGSQWMGATYVRSGDKCIARSFDVAVYELEDVSSSLVTAAIKPGLAQGGLVPLMLEASDGATAFWSWKDEKGSFECTFRTDNADEPVRATDGSIRCMPSLASGVSFADAACTSLATVVTQECMPALAAGADQTKCPSQWSVFPLGAPVQGMMSYQKDATTGACGGASFIATASLRALGSAVMPTELIAATTIEQTSSPRLQPRDLAVPGGGYRLSSFWDSDLKASCEPLQGGDGALRCFPTGAKGVASTLYLDAMCTKHVAIGSVANACYTTFAKSPMDNGALLFKLGRIHQGDIYQTSNGGCKAIPRNSLLLYYEVGAEVPLSSLAVVQEAVR